MLIGVKVKKKKALCLLKLILLMLLTLSLGLHLDVLQRTFGFVSTLVYWYYQADGEFRCERYSFLLCDDLVLPSHSEPTRSVLAFVFAVGGSRFPPALCVRSQNGAGVVLLHSSSGFS
ncbi:hypothetical protein Tco_0451267 [Tanacetum coccineum]